MDILVTGANKYSVMRCCWWKRIGGQVHFYRVDSLKKCIGELQK